MQIEIWSDVKCPWCFVGKRRFETALAGFEHRDQVTVTWKSFQLDPDLPDHYDGTEQQYLAERKGISEDRIREMWDSLSASAAGEGLNFRFEDVVVGNSFTAHRFLHLAKSQGLGDAAKEAILSAHFEQGKDTSDTDFLVELGKEIGLTEHDVRATLGTDRFADDVRHDIAEARTLGISGVPFFVIDRKYGISGAQPADLFAEALTTAWQEANPLTLVNPAGSAAASADGEACGPEGCN
ncbi:MULTISPECIES: DsbA family oxidoreductase [unclassified Arthrobacter]|uniref:DsbA family oxidoreductase n=1 Tax=unclassified Arthrobacter TaxID=235627 RepID=UPI0002D43C2E|nr:MULTISPECIES: DsbA family oxidoreductase [unclassified Arthrobacter]PVE18836.1 DsbA family oxidoreductase [Arthrobacter sp. Bz4]